MRAAVRSQLGRGRDSRAQRRRPQACRLHPAFARRLGCRLPDHAAQHAPVDRRRAPRDARREMGAHRRADVVVGEAADPGLVLSNAFRTALVSALKTLSAEVAAEGITVNAIATGRVATSRLRELYAKRRRDDAPRRKTTCRSAASRRRQSSRRWWPSCAASRRCTSPARPSPWTAAWCEASSDKPVTPAVNVRARRSGRGDSARTRPGVLASVATRSRSSTLTGRFTRRKMRVPHQGGPIAEGTLEGQERDVPVARMVLRLHHGKDEAQRHDHARSFRRARRRRRRVGRNRADRGR